ncbi:ThiF family adenylyltransferase [Sneathiella sp.]|uniref:ThiF family adenylyltransferase n=1 Tax=Sneathiella sp. TaxID=1964365 RepID=UPI002FDF95EC
MSHPLISRSPDLVKLKEDGYEVEIKANHLVIRNVPYVNSKGKVKRGLLVSTLNLAGDVTARPDTHVARFAGEHPCDRHGRPLTKIVNGSGRETLGEGLVVDHSFSSKPKEGYRDYHHKMSTYADMLSGHAAAIDPTATARTFQVIEADDPEGVFEYLDTASSRAGIYAASKKLERLRIAIVGLGGTGAYVLDLVAKTPVAEIHLFDSDWFLQHNAFRSPGAATLKELRDVLKKVHYFRDRYAAMRRNIVAHDVHIDAGNVDMLEGMDFVFLCIDRGDAKLPIIEKLEALGIPFVDVGMGIELVDDKLQGIVRVTTSTARMREHVRDRKRIGLSGGDADNIYAKNIQIADLNALNAALAVIKWKKLFGFYLDLDNEHHATYTIDGNMLLNEEKP